MPQCAVVVGGEPNDLVLAPVFGVDERKTESQTATGRAPAPQITKLRTLHGEVGSNPSGIFSRDGNRLVYATGNDVVIEDTESGENAVKFTGHRKYVWLARFSSDDSRVVSVGQDETIRIWDVSSTKQVSLIIAKTAQHGSVLVVTDKAARITYSTAENRRLVAVDGSTKEPLGTVELKEQKVYWRDVSHNQKLGISNGDRNEVSIWDLPKITSFQIDNGHPNYCGSFSPDGSLVLLGGGFSWDVWNHKEKTKMKGGSVTEAHVYAIAMAPEGSRCLTGLADGTVVLWDLIDSKRISTVRFHESPLNIVAFSPDGKLALSRSNDGVIQLMRLPP